MQRISRHDGTNVRLPADRFYWARIDRSVLPRSRRRSHQHLGYLFENVLPVPVEHVQCAFIEISRDEVIACGIEQDRLADIVDSDSIDSLGPTGPPPFLADIWNLDPAQVNVLRGLDGPSNPNTTRRRWRCAIAAYLILMAGLLVVGMSRGVSQTREATRDARSVAQSAARSMLDRGEADSSLPLTLQVTAQRRRLDQTRGSDLHALRPTSVSHDLQTLFGSWPRDVTQMVDAVVVTDNTITIRGAAESAADVQRLASTLSAMPGWQLQQPEVSNQAAKARFTIRLDAIHTEGGDA